MKAKNASEKIDYLLYYKDLLRFYELENDLSDEDLRRELSDRIECDIDFYLHLSLEEGHEHPSLN